jgi:hypothetical protein
MEKMLDMFNKNVQGALMKLQDTKNKKTWEGKETNKGTQRRLQQTSKWNEGHYKKGDTWIKYDSIKHKRRLEQIYGKPQKKKNRNPGN